MRDCRATTTARQSPTLSLQAFISISYLMSQVLQEQAHGVELPDNAALIRNIILAASYTQNILTHFHHLLALDFTYTAGILEYNGNDCFLLGLKDWVKAEMNSQNSTRRRLFCLNTRGNICRAMRGI